MVSTVANGRKALLLMSTVCLFITVLLALHKLAKVGIGFKTKPPELDD